MFVVSLIQTGLWSVIKAAKPTEAKKKKKKKAKKTSCWVLFSLQSTTQSNRFKLTLITQFSEEFHEKQLNLTEDQLYIIPG